MGERQWTCFLVCPSQEVAHTQPNSPAPTLLLESHPPLLQGWALIQTQSARVPGIGSGWTRKPSQAEDSLETQNHWQKDSLSPLGWLCLWPGSRESWWPRVSPLNENLPSGPPAHKKGDKGGRQREAGDGRDGV